MIVNLGDGRKAFFTFNEEKNEVVFDEGVKYEVIGKDDDGSLFVKTSNYTAAYFVYNPWQGIYLYCNEAKVPNIYIDNHIQIIKCDSLKYIAFPIAKNGCSCLIKSALVYDGIDTAENNDFIWQNYSKTSKMTFFGGEARAILNNEKYKNYKRFIVLQDEQERFIKYINWTHKNKYNKMFDLSLPKHESFMEHIWMQKIMTAHPYIYDQHAASQKLHIKEFIRQLYEGDEEKFNQEVERVHLDNLKDWFQDQFGKPMIMNNIDSEDDKIYKLNELNTEERKALDDLCASY